LKKEHYIATKPFEPKAADIRLVARGQRGGGRDFFDLSMIPLAASLLHVKNK
jgi:hypothetical protein